MGPAAIRDFRNEADVQPEIGVETVCDYRAFLDLEPMWNKLVQAAKIDHPFLEHAWVRTWWECFGEGSSLHVLVVKAGDRAIGIAPLILTPIRMWGIKVQRLGFFYNAHVPRTGFIIAEREDDAHRAIWDHLSRNRYWDLLQLCQLPEGSPTLEAVGRLAATDGFLVGTWKSGESPYVPLHSSWDEYFADLPAKHRSNLRNRLKRIDKEIGPANLETVRVEGLGDALKGGLELEAAAWKGEAGTAISCDTAISRFYSTFAERASEHGWMRLHFLNAGSKRVAFDYSILYKNRIHLLKLGYDPEYARYSPSNLLLSLVLRNAFAERIAEYDFLGEIAEWKLCWAKLSTPHYWLFAFPNSFKGRLLHRIKFQIIPSIKRLRRESN